MNKKSLLKCAVIGLVATLGLAACGTSKDASGGSSSGKEVLEFYHGYHHSEDEWPVAKTMRDLYDKFAEEHKDSGVEFKPIPINGDLKDVMNNKVASGEFPDVIDLAGNAVSLAAIEQKLVLDLKPYIDSNKLEKNVGLNYKQNQKDGKTYVYIQGELTPTDNIPKSGTARYLGLSSYHVNNDTLLEGALDPVEGAPPRFGIVGVDMTANFEDKTVAGHLVHTSAAKNNNVLAELEGTISGNQFSGTKNDTKLQGAFFGENANEMGGVYINEKEGFSGAFSAKSKW